MKHKSLWLLLLFSFVLVSGHAWAKSLETISGFDWLQLEPDERMDKINQAKRELKKNHVPLKIDSERYYDEVYALLRRQQQYYSTDISDLMLIFAQTKETALKDKIEAFQKAS